MKLRLLSIGKTTSPYLREGLQEYKTRLNFYTTFSIVEIPAIKGSKSMSMDEYRKREAAVLLPELISDFTILLDEKGKDFTSFTFARYMNAKLIQGIKSLDFVIGGAFGFHDSVREQADDIISLSGMTFSHEMVRLIFAEQLYRAFTIIRGEKYHHS